MKQVRYCGDGSAYVPNVPADPEQLLELDDLDLAARLVATGLYELVPRKGGGKPSETPEPPPAEGNE